MKLRSAGLAVAVCLAGLWTCRDVRADGVNNPFLQHVVAAETFLADIAQNVVKDHAHVDAMMPPGVDPHEYEPTPADVRKVAECQVLILNGGGMEEFQKDLLRNAGGNPLVVDASKGLASRSARAGEVAEMTAADVADAIAAAADQKATPVVAMKFASSANPLPADSRLFKVGLTTLDDGFFGGCVAYQAEESGDFQLATGAGDVQVLKSPGSGAVAPDRSVAVTAGNLARGYVVELRRGGKYVLFLSGFKTDSTSLLIAPIGEHRETGDPHFWMDPNNVIQYVINIRDGLSMADPYWAANYKKNADDYIVQLKNLDAEIRKQTEQIPADRRLLVTNHDSLGYFADRYGFRIVGTIIPSVSTDASPSPKQLARLVDHIRATHAPAIFLEIEANTQLARQVARETGVKVVTDLYTHSTSGASGPAPTYIQMMRYDVAQIVNTLKP